MHHQRCARNHRQPRLFFCGNYLKYKASLAFDLTNELSRIIGAPARFCRNQAHILDAVAFNFGLTYL